jgi:hypothetical protein
MPRHSGQRLRGAGLALLWVASQQPGSDGEAPDWRARRPPPPWQPTKRRPSRIDRAVRRMTAFEAIMLRAWCSVCLSRW